MYGGGGVLGGRRRGEGTSTYSPFSDRLPEFAHLMYIFYFFSRVHCRLS